MIQEWYGLTLTVPKKHLEQFSMLKELDSLIPFRKVATFASLGLRVNLLVMNTTGKGKRETFKGAKLLEADFTSNGNVYATACAYDTNGTIRVLRINKHSPRVMVSGQFDHETINKFNELGER